MHNYLKMLPKEFKPNFYYKLMRLGSPNDGGYMVDIKSILKSKKLISLGLGTNFDFEKDYYKLTKNSVDVYDHTVTKYSWREFILLSFFNNFINYKNFSPKKFFKDFNLYFEYKKFFKVRNNHFQRKIGYKNPLNQYFKDVEIDDIIGDEEDPIYLKVNIPGCEYRTLERILFYQKKISGLIILFDSIDYHKERIINFIKNLKLNLVHIHGNNNGSYDNNNDPTIVEMVFSNCAEVKSNINEYISEGKPSNPRFPEVKLLFESS
jgi:hypothetical protein